MTAAVHNSVLRRAQKLAEEMEPLLAAALIPVLIAAADDAVKGFRRMVTDHLTAAAPGLTEASTMVALFPRPEEARSLAVEGGEPPEILHLTLAYLGDTELDALAEVVDGLRQVAAAHGPLEGTVAGTGLFPTNPGAGLAILLPDVAGLSELRVDVTRSILSSGGDYARNHGFLPHLSVDYRPGDVQDLTRAEDGAGGAGEAAAVRGSSSRRMLDLREESVPGRVRSGEGGRPDAPSPSDRLGSEERPPGAGSAFAPPLRERAVHQRDASRADGETTARATPQPAPNLLLGPRDSVRAAKQARLGDLPGLRSRGDAALSVSESGGIRPAVEVIAGSKAGLPLHFDDLVVARGDVVVARLPLTGVLPLTAGAVVATSETGRRVAEVARAHAPEGGYGNASWHPGTGAVYWVSADWTSTEEIEEARGAFLAIEGVESFDYDAESCVPESDGWEAVYCTSACGGCAGAVTAAASPEEVAATRRQMDSEAERLRAALLSGDESEVAASKAALRAARYSLRDAATSAGRTAGWTAPAADEILNVDQLAASFRGVTDPIREAAIRNVFGSTLDASGVAWETTNPYLAHVMGRVGQQITNVARTTMADVMEVVGSSYGAGLSIADTARSIQAAMLEATPARAVLIARTELVGAVSGGSLAAVQAVSSATGQPYTKTWLTGEGATYPRHEDYDGLDGQTVPLDGYFDVGDAQLMFPGDPAGPPEEICNCRCTAVYREAGGDTEEISAD